MTGKLRTPAPPAKAAPAPMARTRADPKTAFPAAPEASRERGNRLHGFWLRTRMAVGSPDDPQEGQAQRMADRAMGSPIQPALPLHPDLSPLPRLQPQAPPGDPGGRPWGYSGLPLSPSLRGFFDPRLRFDFSGVRIHHGPEAAAASLSLGARAFTYGSDIVFGAGHWRPETWEGRRLLAHELAHVVQSRGLATGIIRRDLDDDLAMESGSLAAPGSEGEDIPADPPLEAEELDYAFVFAGGSYGRAARAFLRAYRPGHRLIEAHSFEALFDALHADLRRRRDRRPHVREIVLVSHANRDGGLRIALSREDVAPGRFFNPWHVRDLQNEFREGEHGRFRSRRHEVVTEMFDSATRVLVRGCEFGESDEGLRSLRLLFGGEPEVWAPRGYQGFETLRIGGSLLRTPEQAYDFLVEQGYLPLDGADVSDAEKRAYIVRVFGSSGLIPADFFVMDGEDYAGLRAEMDAGRGMGEIAEGFKTRGVSDIPSAGEYWNLSASDPLGSDPELDALSLDEIESRAQALNSPYRPRHAAMLRRLRLAWERKGLETLDRGDADDPLAGLPPEAIFGDPNIVDMDAHRYPGPPRPSVDAFDAAVIPLPPSEADGRAGSFDSETGGEADADRGSAYALSLDFSKSMRPPSPPEASASGPERPRSLDGSLDTMDLSGRELEREVDLLVAWLEIHGEDSEENLRLRSDLARLSRELDHRGVLLEGSDILVREGDLASLFIMGLEQHFLQGFLAAAAYELRPRDLIRFGQDLLLPSLAHRAGMAFGVVQGVGEDLYSNLAGLVELLSLLDPTLAIRLMAEEAVDYIRDPEAYMDELNRHIRALQEVAGGIQEFIAAIIGNPRLLIIQSRALGVEAGLRAADYFNDGYMAQDDFDRGRDLGRIMGVILTEIALLFLGPEEWIGRAATAAGQATRLAGEVTHAITLAATRVRGASRGILRIMEEIPGLRRALRALTEWDSPGHALSEAADAIPSLPGADEVARGPLRGVVEGGGETTARRRGHLSAVPDSPPRDPGPIPEAPAMPVPAEAEAAEALDMASGGETFSRGRHGDAPLAMADRPPRSREGGTVIDMTSRRRMRSGASGPHTPSGEAVPRASLDSPSPLPAASAMTAAESRLAHAEPGTLAFDDLFDEAGEFLHLNPESNPTRHAEIERLRALYRRHGRRRANPRDWLISTRSGEARSILDGGLLAPDWRNALRRAERLAAARRLIPDPEPWQRISDLETRCPGLRDSHLIPVPRDFSRSGMVEESLWTDLGDYSFEGLFRDGRRHQIDGFDELGRLIEHKSRTDPEFVARETEALSLGRRQHAIEMLRDVEFAEEAGLPGVLWQTDSPELAVELRIIAGEEGLIAREGDSRDFFRVLLLH